MSAEKPEVGDVWEDSKGMVHISRIFTLGDLFKLCGSRINVANNVSKPNSQHFCNIFERLYK